MIDPYDWQAHWLPRYPLATDELSDGVYRVKRAAAVGKRYIEANPHGLVNVLATDIDAGDAVMRSYACTGYLPTWIVENPSNGHAHALWGLKAPIATTEYSRRKPVAYAHAITEGLRMAVDGDKGYAGLIIKNPSHTSWGLYPGGGGLYSLDELKNALEADNCLPAPSWKRTKRRNLTGLGRNCSIFEFARLWAYRELRRHFGDPQGLEQAIWAHVQELNSDFPDPLDEREAWQIAQSITGWIITKSRLWKDGEAVYEATFIAIQSARGKKNHGISKQTPARKRILEVLDD